MIGFAPDSSILANLDQYVGVIEYVIKRELTPSEIKEAAEARARKISAIHHAEWIEATDALLGARS